MVLRLVSHELERIWKELSLVYSRFYVGIQGYTGMTLCLWMSGCWGFQRIIMASSQGQAILQMLANTHPTTQRHIPDTNPQQVSYKNLQFNAVHFQCIYITYGKFNTNLLHKTCIC